MENLSNLSKESPILPSQEFNYIWKEISSDIVRQMNRDDELEYEGEQLCDSTQLHQGRIDQMLSNQGLILYNFSGNFNFKLFLRNNGTYKYSWEYSKVLNQVFIDMNKVLMVFFNYDCPKPEEEQTLFIRGTLVYCNSESMAVPVNRCTLHSLEDDPSNKAHENNICHCLNYNLVGHVLRSQSTDALYSYDPQSKRHSVRVPVPYQHSGKHTINILYTFCCKTSCQKGMHRRPINIVFTLENSKEEVLGCATLAVKVCSCPKRDKYRLEKELKKIKDEPEEDPLAETTINLNLFQQMEIVEKLKVERKNLCQMQAAITKLLKNLDGLIKQYQ